MLQLDVTIYTRKEQKMLWESNVVGILSSIKAKHEHYHGAYQCPISNSIRSSDK